METIEFKPIKEFEVIKSNLGSGSFGKTKLIKDNSIDELFVCKKYDPQDGIKKEDFYKNFKKEIKLMYNINHPNIVRIYNYYLYDDYYTGYIIMEYIEGGNIDKWFENYWLAKKDANDIFRQLIEGFSEIENKGIIHRDIRESNILVTKDDVVKVIDFGLGKDVNESNLSLDSFDKLINRRQMEKQPQEFSEGKYTNKTDMFCLAEMFDRLLKKYNINDFKHNYILQKMLNIEPEKRYSSFRDIIQALDTKEFKILDISEEDRILYNNFANSLVSCIGSYKEANVKFQNNITNILSGLEEVLEENCLNYKIENIVKFIEIFVLCDFTYYEKNIDVEDVQKFYNWLIQKNDNFKNVILKNILSKLSRIKIDDSVFLPF